MRYLTLVLLAQLLFLSSCHHFYYMSNSNNVPMLKQKGDLKISGGYGGWNKSTGVELQSAYAVSEKIGLMADFMTVTGGDKWEKNYGKGYYFEGGCGYYKLVKRYFEFETYGGLGFSGQRHEYSEMLIDQGTGEVTYDYQGNSRLSFVKLYIQPSFGLTLKNFEAIVSTRFSSVSFNDIDCSPGTANIYRELNVLEYSGHTFFEPALTLRAGHKNIKLQGSLVFTRYIGQQEVKFFQENRVNGGVIITFPLKIR